MLAWLSVWSEVQTCMWPSGCHCHSLSLASVTSRLVLPAHLGVPEKGQEGHPVCVCVCVNRHNHNSMETETQGDRSWIGVSKDSSAVSLTLILSLSSYKRYTLLVTPLWLHVIYSTNTAFQRGDTRTHAHVLLTILCPGLPGSAGTRLVPEK